MEISKVNQNVHDCFYLQNSVHFVISEVDPIPAVRDSVALHPLAEVAAPLSTNFCNRCLEFEVDLYPLVFVVRVSTPRPGLTWSWFEVHASILGAVGFSFPCPYTRRLDLAIQYFAIFHAEIVAIATLCRKHDTTIIVR